MSGSAADSWAINKDPLKLAKKQAALLNCPTETSEDLVNCIKEKPAQDTARIYSRLWVCFLYQNLLRPIYAEHYSHLSTFLMADLY